MPPKQRSKRVELSGTQGRANKRLLGGGLGAAVLVTAVAIVISVATGGHKTATPSNIIAPGALLDGIPEHGLVLGNPQAKVTLTEYVDTSCPVCKDYVLTAFPSIVRRYVRPGKVKVEARVLAFVGPSSARGRELVLAASRQNRAWQFLELDYNNQGDEQTAWLTDDIARAFAAKVPGLNVDNLFRDAGTTEVQHQAQAMEAAAQTDGVRGTPTFFVTTPDGQRHLLGIGAYPFAAFQTALDRALKG